MKRILAITFVAALANCQSSDRKTAEERRFDQCADAGDDFARSTCELIALENLSEEEAIRRIENDDQEAASNEDDAD